MYPYNWCFIRFKSGTGCRPCASCILACLVLYAFYLTQILLLFKKTQQQLQIPKKTTTLYSKFQNHNNNNDNDNKNNNNNSIDIAVEKVLHVENVIRESKKCVGLGFELFYSSFLSLHRR